MLEYRLTEADVRAASPLVRRVTRRRFRVAVAAGLAAGTLAWGGMFLVTADPAWEKALIVTLVLFYPVAFGLLVLMLRFLQNRVLWKTAERLGDIALSVGADGVWASDATTVSQSKWSRYAGYLENDHAFVLHEKAWPGRCVIIPNRALPDTESIEQLRDLFAQRLPRIL